MESRLIALEEQLMFLERHVQQLDEQVRSLAGDLLSARRELARVQELDTQRYERLLERLDAAGGDVPAGGDSDAGPSPP